MKFFVHEFLSMSENRFSGDLKQGYGLKVMEGFTWKWSMSQLGSNYALVSIRSGSWFSDFFFNTAGNAVVDAFCYYSNKVPNKWSTNKQSRFIYNLTTSVFHHCETMATKTQSVSYNTSGDLNCIFLKKSHPDSHRNFMHPSFLKR